MRGLIFLFSFLFFAFGPVSAQELQMPQIPDSLRTAPLRAAYLIEHFWDNMDFSDTALSTDPQFIEQNFSNYASLFPHTDIDSVLPAAAKTLMQRAESNRDAYNLLAQTADTYLYEPESPVANENAYLYFLKAITDSQFIDSALRIRYEVQLQDVLKNRPGTVATDFDLRLRNGDTTTLLNKCKSAKANLLLFYDPDCSDCATLVNYMKRDTSLAKAIASGHLNIIAVYPEGDETQFAGAAGKIPDEWTDAINPEGAIIENELFNIPSFPTIYLLDAEGKVLLKNADPEVAINEAKNLTL
ncbi:MAG: DUF5106 domain-containing protein [Paramuribaculum sp.]|nr:DUF5106 domain-containing protein [Paramuribaculum sp.]